MIIFNVESTVYKYLYNGFYVSTINDASVADRFFYFYFISWLTKEYNHSTLKSCNHFNRP